ncbi:MAG: TonB-dependent receptor [Candidatus Marinimicrobia bacterium]|nr:TonB-dependent receptor [Candidatus Neomarinimicrobiota bacterium]
MQRNDFRLVLLMIFSYTLLFPQTTGKIMGTVSASNTGEPLMGANVIIEGQSLGAATDENGQFYIINLPPGEYTVLFNMIGYAIYKVEKVRVSVNQSTTINANLSVQAVEGETVVVTASKISTKKGQTGSVQNVSADKIEALPVQSLGEIVNMQAGVVAGHFRGGRSGEVQYMTDGLNIGSNVEKEVVQEVEVITGIFSAKYGRAMSGIVNAVTKDGSNQFQGKMTGNLSNYYTTHRDLFWGLDPLEIDRTRDFNIFAEGPLVRDKLFFVANYRNNGFVGHLNGKRLFNPIDYNDYKSPDSTKWWREKTGDGKTVPMNTSQWYSLYTKLTFKPVGSAKLSFTYQRENSEGQGYSHYMKFNPDGRGSSYGKSDIYTLQFNHMLGHSFFYEIKGAYEDQYSGSYKYKDPTSEKYIHPNYSGRSDNTGFSTGGESQGYYEGFTKELNLKADFNWQMNPHQGIMAGVLYTGFDMESNSLGIRSIYDGTSLHTLQDTIDNKVVFLFFEPIVMPNFSVYSDIYHHKPYQFSGYIEDKMEYDDMVINFGLRFDLSDPKCEYPSQRRNPANQLYFPDSLSEKMSTRLTADVKAQVSPRFGISYKLGETAVLRFGYGHFFQMPSFGSMYANDSWLVPSNDYGTVMGNPQINAQKTVQYEIGLWQQLARDLGLEVTVFYRDIYELLSTKIITTFNQVRYGLYTNKDYGNVRGMELKLDYAWKNFFAAMNYTLQYTRGVADNATSAFSRAGSKMDPVSTLIPLSWDQRHTLNFSTGYNTHQYGVTITGYFNSGTRYSWSPLAESPLSAVKLYPNNSVKPSTFTMDMRCHFHLLTYKGASVRLNVLIYNLLDIKNQVGVYSTTGKAGETIIREQDLENHHSDFATYEDRIKDPSQWSAPRQIQFGVDLKF